jgi:DUF971 family protein
MCQGHAATTKYLGCVDQKLLRVEPVGNYALSITWADGHSTGIYAFRYLRAICPCVACGGERRTTL